MITITTAEQTLIAQSKAIARQWGFTYLSAPTLQDDSFFLQLSPHQSGTQQLQLQQNNKNSPGAIAVDFSSGQSTHRRLFGGGKGQTLAKAVGLNKTPLPVILDATAGMGKDAFVFASLGAQVILMERSPIAAALLNDGLRRGLLDKEISEIIQRITLIHGDTRLIRTDITPDVIYLDPMFPHKKKSAQVKKEMLAFQSLIGADNDSDELLSICRQQAKKRVVVKRPVKAPFLAAEKPSFSIKMKKHRFDIYLCNNQASNNS